MVVAARNSGDGLSPRRVLEDSAGAISEFRNVAYRFESPSGKPIFVPSEKGQRIGLELRALLSRYRFPVFFRHFRAGGHIGILHRHRRNAWFCHIDLQSFFYTVARNRVAAALRAAGVRQHQQFAKWSTVRSPYGPGYVLPYGFPQSTLLASLVMAESPLGAFLRAAARIVAVEVYVDDISLSCAEGDEELLGDLYGGLLEAVDAAGFKVNQSKASPPARAVRLFGCDLEKGRVSVSEERRAGFYAVEGTGWSSGRFERYCRAVETGNAYRLSLDPQRLSCG